MKVLIVIPGFPLNTDEIKGGVFSALSNLLKGFTNKHIDVRVLSFNREITEPVKIKYASNIEIQYTPESKLPHAINFLFFGSSILKKHIKEFNPSIVHYAMSGYILLTKVFGIYNKPQLVTIHGIAFPEARLKEKLKEKLVWYSNGIIELLLCPHNIIHLSNYSLQLSKKKPDGKTTIIPNAINDHFFDVALKNKTDNKLLYIGGIDSNKNILFLLQTLKALLNKNLLFTLEVLGDFLDEHYKAVVEAFISNNQLEKYINLHGWVSQQKVMEVLALADILVVSSKQESLPMVIAEAMSAGKVVVASNVGGISEMIEHKTDGFTFNISDVQNVVPILEQLYNNNDMVLQIERTAKTKALTTYQSDIVAQKTINFYTTLLQ